MLEHLNAFTKATKKVDTIEGLEKAFLKYLESLDVAYFTCVNIYGPGGVYQPHQYFGAFNKKWVDHYREQGFLEADPSFLYGVHNNNPFGFQELASHKDLPNIARRVMMESQDFEMADGLVTTLKGVQRELSFITVAGPDYQRNADKDGLLELMCHQAFRRATQIKHLESQCEELNLTKRQLWVLKYVSAGMTDKEIARELNISPKTVNHHIEAAKARLDAKSRSQATRNLMRRGLLI
jgi:DNA-binding CsgD family transcriptional regulator